MSGKRKSKKQKTSFSNSFLCRKNPFFAIIRRRAPRAFRRIEKAIESGGMRILPDAYITFMLNTTLLTAALFFLSALAKLAVSYSAKNLMLLLVYPLVTSLFVFLMLYLYPQHKVSLKRAGINASLPFALNHMAAIASSGVPPDKVFRLLSEFSEYGEFSSEMGNIMRRVDVFGEDITRAIRHVALNTPSRKLKEVLYGILSVIESGGDLKEYLNQMSESSLFEYRLDGQKYVEKVSTYADIYTAVLIAAPLLMVTTLAVMGAVSGSRVAGMTIETLLDLGVYAFIPLLNLVFISVLVLTEQDS